jgi:hypothetical protein
VARLCTICTHARRDTIDAALLVHSEGYRNIAEQYGVDYVSLWRHAHTHLAEQIRESKALSEMLSADNLLAKLGELDRETREMLTEARTAGKINVALSAVRESRGNIEAFARIGPMSEVEQRLRALEAAQAQQKGGGDVE